MYPIPKSWTTDGFSAGLNRELSTTDKDFIRSWVSARCDPYKEPIPRIPDEIINQTSRVYAQAYEAITGKEFVPDLTGDTVLDRIRGNLKRYF